jgi:cytoskeletal protein CcmA (bactofilin family)
MFDKKKDTSSNEEKSIPDVFRPSKGSAKVVIGNGVSITGEIKKADEVQIDGEADVTMKTDNLVIGNTGICKGNIETHNADIWGSFDGDIKASGTLTIQEAGVATGTIEYQNMQIKLGGKLSGDIKISDKIQSIKKETNQSDNNKADSLQNSIKSGDN